MLVEGREGRGGGKGGMYPADQALVFGEMGFAVLAAVDLVAGEVVVVYQTHGCGLARSVERLVFGVFAV